MRILVLLLCLATSVGYAQVGINTTSPEGTLDIVTTNNTGLVLPRVTDLESVTDGNGGDPVNGTTVYDLSRNAICFYQNGRWSCIEQDINGIPTLVDASPRPFEDCNYIKASNTAGGDRFGISAAISGDGNTLVVGASSERSNATGINGDQFDNSLIAAGAVYVFTRAGGVWAQEAYIKASNTDAVDSFGGSVALSGNGNTLVVEAALEDSNATGINGDQTDNSAGNSGAVYVFERAGGVWSQEAYIKASNTEANDRFGTPVAVSDDGNTLAVGATFERSNATGINGDQTDNSAGGAGAVYVFERAGGVWNQEAYIKASNTDAADSFGWSVALSGDGNTLAVGAVNEDSNAIGINGDQTDNSAGGAGAVYVFERAGGVWSQEAYIKASNTGVGDRFGSAVALSGNGNTLMVGVESEDSNASGINGDQTDNSAGGAGAVYVFERAGGVWTQEAYIKASNTDANDLFGYSVAISGDGNTLVVGAILEDSNTTGSNGDQLDNSVSNSGATYVFKRAGGVWSQEAYMKASNTDIDDRFGFALAISDNGNTVAVGALGEQSNATGINGDQSNNTLNFSGAVYVCDN